MSAIINNTQAIQEFVNKLELMDNHSNIFFHANIDIETSKNKTVIDDRVQITLDGYDNSGRVILLGEDNELDSALFPISFDAKWQNFEFVNNSFLKISGKHNKNPQIASYVVTITPI